MRNLTIIGRESLGAQPQCPKCDIQAVTVASAGDEVFVAGVDRTYKSAQNVKIYLWHQLPNAAPGSNSEIPAFAPCSEIVPAAPCPFSQRSQQPIPPRSAHLYGTDTIGEAQSEVEIISLQYLNDGGAMADYMPALCLVTAGGDILHARLPSREDAAMRAAETTGDNGYEAPPITAEVVGSIEQGIYAAQWSPDEEFLVVVTAPTLVPQADGEPRWEGEKILILTKDFEVLSERQLATDEFGEDKPVDVGWGSKATQFHGSEGKAAAAAAAAEAEAASMQRDTRGPHTLDDDGRPRISWKGDASFFAVSSLERSPLASTESSDSGDAASWNRVLRVFTRTGALSSTSDAKVRGVSQALAYKPLGNLIATTQRFGRCELQRRNGAGMREVQWSQGRDGRHDVIFFERNGLRHGEFTLREEGPSQPKGLTFPSDAAGEQHVHARACPPQTWKRRHFVRDVAWNLDGSALAVVLEQHDSALPRTVVQIWTMGNYHYYLKQEIPIASGALHGLPSAVVRWHPEDAMQLYIAEQHEVIHITFAHETCTTLSLAGLAPASEQTQRSAMLDAACVAVADGAATLLTPFRLQNVPPPMCTTSLLAAAPELGGKTPVHYAWSSLPPPARSSAAPLSGSADVLAILYADSTVGLVLFDWGVLGRRAPVGGRPVPAPMHLGTIALDGASSDFAPLQVAILASRANSEDGNIDVSICVAGTVRAGDGSETCNHAAALVGTWRQQEPVAKISTTGFKTERPVSRLRLAVCPGNDQVASCFVFAREMRQGRRLNVQLISSSHKPEATELSETLPTFCSDLIPLSTPGQMTLLGLTSNGQLLANARVLAQGVNSFTVAASFLIWTNNSHEARFLALTELLKGSSSLERAPAGEIHTLQRAVERGSRIVTAVPSEMALVLQMPRGNLETITPRPLVLEVVRRDLDKLRFRSALRICRAHRIDLNLLHDHDPSSFMANLSLFVKQVADVDHIDLFLTSLKDEDVTTTLYQAFVGAEVVSPSGAHPADGKTNRICQAMRVELERLDSAKYLQSILTSYVRQTPPDYEGALRSLLDLKESDADAAGEAVKYLVFLADAEKLYDVALGMYDFTLALMLAQHASRKDPREYIPFLRELRGVEPVQLQRFQIDDHLGRHAKAFRWIAEAGEAHRETAFKYMQKHELYESAFAAFQKDPERLRRAYELYGDWMVGRSKQTDAAAAYIMASTPRKAVDAYQQAGLWQDALSTAMVHRFSPVEVTELARTVVSDLEASNRLADAAQVSLTHLRDVESAVSLLCRANDIPQAKRMCALYKRMDLIETTVKPESLDAQAAILETIGEMREQLTKQVARLCELLAKVGDDGESLLPGEEARELDNIDVMSDTSTQITQFTRYTRALTATTSASSSHRSRNSQWRASNERRKKEQKKQAGGRKGSVYEESYLYGSLQRLLKDKLKEVQEDVERLALAIVPLSSAHRNAAVELQSALLAFEAAAAEGVTQVYEAGIERERRVFEKLEEQGNSAARAAATGGDRAGAPDPSMALMRSYMQLAALALDGKVRGRERLEISAVKWRSSLLGVLDPKAK